MSGEVPTLSAVVVVFNGIDFLPDCLRTLTDDLKDIDHELTLVDNGSTDGSVEFIRLHYPEARLIENRVNLGYAKAVNIGVAASVGKYLYILNQDLRFRPGTARTLLERLSREPTLGLIGPGYVDFHGRPQRSVRAFPTYRHVFYRALLLDRLFPAHREFSHWRMGWFDHKDELCVDQPMGAVMMIPRRVIEEVGSMDETFPILFSDVDYCKRIQLAGYRLVYYPQVEVEHFVGGSTGRWPYRMKVISHLSMYRFLRKYARSYEQPVLWLCGLVLLLGLFPAVVLRFLHRALARAKLSS